MAIRKHPIGIDLASVNKKELPPNPELSILKNKRKEYLDALHWGETDLTFFEWILTDKTTWQK